MKIKKKFFALLLFFFIFMTLTPKFAVSTDDPLVWEDTYYEEGNYSIYFQVDLQISTPSQFIRYQNNQFQINITITPSENVWRLMLYHADLEFAPESDNLADTMWTGLTNYEFIYLSETSQAAHFSCDVNTNNTFDFTDALNYYFKCEINFGYNRIYNGSDEGTNIIHITEWKGPISVDPNKSQNPLKNQIFPLIIDWKQFFIFLGIVELTGISIVSIYLIRRKRYKKRK